MRDSPIKHIKNINKQFGIFLDGRLKDYDISARQCAYILSVSDNPGITQDKLAELLFVNKSSVTRRLSCLEEKGLIRRELNSADLRQMLVFPTEKAIMVCGPIKEAFIEWDEAVISRLKETDEELFQKLIAKVDKISEEVAAL